MKAREAEYFGGPKDGEKTMLIEDLPWDEEIDGGLYVLVPGHVICWSPPGMWWRNPDPDRIPEP